MRINFIVFSLTIWAVNLAYGADIAIHFNPHKIETRKSVWTRSSVKYDDYIYDGKVMFRVLENLDTQMNCLIQEAKNINGNLVMKNPGSFFITAEGIKKSFDIKPKKAKPKRKHFVTVEPESISLVREMSHNMYHYFISFAGEDGKNKAEISAEVYNAIQFAKGYAKNNNQSLKINIVEVFRQESHNLGKCVAIIKKINNENQCVVCLEKRKDVLLEPCHHLCLCEDCGAKIEKCPLCNNNVEKKSKVFY